MTWMSRALCRTRPADWWSTGDEGNRLALALCSVCPERPLCAGGDPRPVGVIRGGVAYDEDGYALALCACGQPAPLGREDCFTCVPRITTKIPKVRSRRRVVENRQPVSGTRDERIFALYRQGVSYREIGFEYGVSKTMVGRIVHRLRTQAVSTVVDG